MKEKLPLIISIIILIMLGILKKDESNEREVKRRPKILRFVKIYEDPRMKVFISEDKKYLGIIVYEITEAGPLRTGDVVYSIEDDYVVSVVSPYEEEKVIAMIDWDKVKEVISRQVR